MLIAGRSIGGRLGARSFGNMAEAIALILEDLREEGKRGVRDSSAVVRTMAE